MRYLQFNECMEINLAMADSDDALHWTGRLDPAAGPRYLQIVAQLETLLSDLGVR